MTSTTITFILYIICHQISTKTNYTHKSHYNNPKSHYTVTLQHQPNQSHFISYVLKYQSSQTKLHIEKELS